VDVGLEAVREIERDVDGPFHALGAVGGDHDRIEHIDGLRSRSLKRPCSGSEFVRAS